MKQNPQNPLNYIQKKISVTFKIFKANQKNKHKIQEMVLFSVFCFERHWKRENFRFDP